MKRLSQQLGGLAQLLTTMGGEVTQVVQDMHGTIANPFKIRGEGYTAAPVVYDLIRYGFRQAGNLAGFANLAADPDQDLRDNLTCAVCLTACSGNCCIPRTATTRCR